MRHCCHCDMYGPITIGGPCIKCGQRHDPHVSCKQHSDEMQRQIKQLLRGIDFSKGQRIPNCWAGIPLSVFK